MSAVARRYYDRGRAALEVNDLESAQEALRAPPAPASILRAGLGRASSPISAAAMHATLGDVLTMGGDFFGAEEAFQTAAQTPGFEVRVASGLARFYARLGRYRDMAAQLRRAAQPR